MTNSERIATRFNALDLHDDTIRAVRVLASTDRKGKTRIEVELYRHWEARTRVLVFHGCANISFRTDFDVLAGNLPSNTSGVRAWSDLKKMERLIRGQRATWDLTYEPETFSPMYKKLNELSKYVLFRLQLFGGSLEIIAPRFSISEINGNAP